MFVLGRDIVYDRSTACARDVSCEKTFSQEIIKYPSNVPFVLNSKAQIINTVSQYHCSLDICKWPDYSLKFELLPVAHEVCL